MDSRISLAFILISSLGFSSAFLLGGSEKTATVRFHKGSEFGFEKNPNVYAHLVIPPWNRPFKPGYCASWEWHTDKKYRDKRIAICKQYTEGKLCNFKILKLVLVNAWGYLVPKSTSETSRLAIIVFAARIPPKNSIINNFEHLTRNDSAWPALKESRSSSTW